MPKREASNLEGVLFSLLEKGMVMAISLLISEREGMVMFIDTLLLPIKERVIMVIGIVPLLEQGMG